MKTQYEPWVTGIPELRKEQTSHSQGSFEYTFRKSYNFWDEAVEFAPTDYRQGDKRICGEITVIFPTKDAHKEFQRKHFYINHITYYCAKWGTDMYFMVKFTH